MFDKTVPELYLQYYHLSFGTMEHWSLDTLYCELFPIFDCWFLPRLSQAHFWNKGKGAINLPFESAGVVETACVDKNVFESLVVTLLNLVVSMGDVVVVFAFDFLKGSTNGFCFSRDCV